MNRILSTILLASLVSFLGLASKAPAEMITVGTAVASNGDILLYPGGAAGSWNAAVGSNLLAVTALDGSNGVSGSDFDPGSSYDGSWSFNYTPPVNPLASAFLSFGIIDHDSAAAGDQVASFSVDGFDLTTQLNVLFNASGGRVIPTLTAFQSEYNVYSIDLTIPALLASLADGNADVRLTLKNGFAGAATLNNGAAVDFSTLTINSVPEPSSLVLLLFGISAAASIRRRRG